MTNMKKIKWCMLLLTGSLLLAGTTVQAASAEKQLRKGIAAYQNNDTDKAMDYFVDVLMNGDAQQVAQANQYINAIHNRVGGLRSPVEVDVSFPDQPNQSVVNQTENLANYGTERLDTLATEGEQVLEQTRQALGNSSKSLTEQIEERQLAEYVKEGIEPVVREKSPTQSRVVVPSQHAALEQAAALDQAAADGTVLVSATPSVLVEQAGTTAAQQDLRVVSNDILQQAQVDMGQRNMLTTADQVVVVQVPSNTESSATTFSDLTSPAAVEARNLYTAQKLQSMMDGVVSDLASNPGVHLYMRADGKPDAIDIDHGVLFQGNSFRADALPTLNSVYELLALTQGARFVILPAGSYTDDVTLPSIRRAMALKSYLSKRGISQGKLYYNMGLVDQEVPAQFSDLKGLSIVFDYDAKLPTRLLDNESHEKAPLLSMAIVPPCRAIDRSIGEAYAVDFSVLETVNTLDNWVLQVVMHGRNGNYYVVRQLEGFSPVYHQILWNGRKGIIGPELPCGKYTFVLTGVDLQGNKQTLRRRVIVKCASDPAPSCQTGKCPAKPAATRRTTSSGKLNYKAARLWKKPGRTVQHCSSMEGLCGIETVEEVTATVEQPVQTQAAVATQQAQATSTADSSYTVTKTVRNIVTNDTGTVASSSEAMAAGTAGYEVPPAEVTNPYGMPYEEEYMETASYETK